MHPAETHNRFIELRSQGWTLARIAGELNVSKRTLIQWQRQHQAQIADLRALELEALQDRVLASHEKELASLASQLDRVEAILAKRKLECLSTEFLFCMAGALRSQIRKQRINPVFPGASSPATPAETSETFPTPPSQS
jgi:orotate phosphoribosyltransferase-like protein